jgi:hypothetical protein
MYLTTTRLVASGQPTAGVDDGASQRPYEREEGA